MSLKIRVQCPNWFDINRVQVFVNGRPEQSLNFTRKATPEQFSDETVRFDATLPLPLITDAHVIVATIGEGLELGPVMGPNYGGKLPPVAVSQSDLRRRRWRRLQGEWRSARCAAGD